MNVVRAMRRIIENAIAKADLILVGIGEEFACDSEWIRKIPEYQTMLNRIEKDKEQLGWLTPFLIKDCLDNYEAEAIDRAYEILASLLRDKNYFIVTENSDDQIFRSLLDRERIVAPCGNYTYLQCEDNCSQQLIPAKETVREVSDSCRRLWDTPEQIARPLCTHCGKPLVFNTVKAPVYQESVYLPMWNQYMKWLQGTLHKNVCILELGVGFRYPTVIRWPFERAAYLNRKADFIRIHHSLYQLSEELKEKGTSISENAVDFLQNIFVQ